MRVLYFTGLLLLASSIHGKVIVKKCYHHLNCAEHKAPSLELGNIVFYFDAKPDVKTSIDQNSTKRDHTFIIPEAELESHDLLDVISRINTAKNPYYTVRIVPIKSPEKGLKVVFTYDEQNIGVRIAHYNSISMQKALVFQIYNKDVLRKMHNDHKPILQTAFINPRVVIDCGHGGIDRGTIGCNGIAEKDVNLAIGLAIAGQLEKNNIDVALTRSSDKTVALDERTAYANTHAANLLISIHANAALNQSAKGIETYCLHENLFEWQNNCNDDSLVNQWWQSKHHRSYTFAHCVHSALLKEPLQFPLKDRSIRYAAPQVLLGASMPAILVEVGYLSNKDECLYLSQKTYQQYLAQRIAQGIATYLNGC